MLFFTAYPGPPTHASCRQHRQKIKPLGSSPLFWFFSSTRFEQKKTNGTPPQQDMNYTHTKTCVCVCACVYTTVWMFIYIYINCISGHCCTYKLVLSIETTAVITHLRKCTHRRENSGVFWTQSWSRLPVALTPISHRVTLLKGASRGADFMPLGLVCIVGPLFFFLFLFTFLQVELISWNNSLKKRPSLLHTGETKPVGPLRENKNNIQCKVLVWN